MNQYVAAGSLALIVGGLAGLVWFAERAGRNGAAVNASRRDATEANAATDRVQAMAQAQADGPHTTAALLDRLDKGDA